MDGSIRRDDTTVMLFPTCLVDAVEPGVGLAASRVLERVGHPVVVPDGATCCGQPAWNAGQTEAAAKVARTTLSALAGSTGPIVVPSGSCTTMIRVFWPELFEIEGSAAERALVADVAARTEELSEFLADRYPDGTPDDPTPTVYHRSCHMLRELGIEEQPEDLLETTSSDVRVSSERGRCCGFGGLFSVKLPEVSTAMADEVLDAVVDVGAERVVGCDVSCLMHLEGRSRRRGLGLEFVHLVELLDEDQRP